MSHFEGAVTDGSVSAIKTMGENPAHTHHDRLTDVAAAEIEAEGHETDPTKDWVPDGAVAWDTTSRLTRPAGTESMGRLTTEYVEHEKQFSEMVVIQHDKPFVLKPLILCDGPFKGQRVLLLEPAKRANFFKIAPELRNTIYEMVLREEQPIPISTANFAGKGKRSEHPALPAWTQAGRRRMPVTIPPEPRSKGPRRLALLMVNKQIYQETASIAYGSNSSAFTSTEALSRFLRDAVPARKHMRSVTFTGNEFWWGISRPNNSLPFASDLVLDNLQTVRVECESVYYHALSGGGKISVADLARELVPFLRRWKDARASDAGAKSVLDVVEFVNAGKCRACSDGTADNTTVRCRAASGRNCAEHRQNVAAKFRAMVGAALASPV